MRPNTSAASLQVELGQPVDEGLVEHVALVAAWRVPPTPMPASVRSRSFQASVATALEAVVRVVDVGLLVGEIGVLLGHPSLDVPAG